ncbi:hypothetical protein Glove_212g86 [Diversispora epigaea]|uniref:Uncharacterized protein n=1 Tax=Diversispora epigaea TaxID=1348612 RepID=A0A397IPP7_9GLOM|nr:hypothetical protein Glove_212g86 [Diversispora epigaea]
MYDNYHYRMTEYYDYEYKEEEHREFVKEYGWRKEWECCYFTDWDDWLYLFDEIKDHWNEKENPEALLQGFMNSNVFTLAEIVSLIEEKDLSNIAYNIWGKDECPPSYFESDSEDEQSELYLHAKLFWGPEIAILRHYKKSYT